MIISRRFALLAPLALAACGRAAKPAVLTLREANDHLVIPVTFDAASTLALLDNGAPLTSLDRRFAETAHLKRSGSGAGLAPLEMSLGDASVRIHPDLEDMTEASIATDAPVAAIAGMELFNAFVVGIDFSHGQLTLHRRPSWRPERQALTLDLQTGGPPNPGVEIAINGRPPVRAFFDLGCSSALLVSPRLAQAYGLDRDRLVSTRQVILSGAQGLGIGVSRRTSIERLAFAGQSLADVPIDIMPQEARPFAGIDAVIGIPLLRRFDLMLDLPRRIAITPNNRIGQPFERRMTGLQTKPQDGLLLVRHVAEGSPAQAAGFAAGDLISAIDGAAPLMRTLRNAPEGQTLVIQLKDGRVRKLTGARYY